MGIEKRLEKLEGEVRPHPQLILVYDEEKRPGIYRNGGVEYTEADLPALSEKYDLIVLKIVYGRKVDEKQ